MTESWREVLSAWDDLRMTVDEYRDLDDGRILVLNRFSGRGKTSGLDLGRMHAEVANLVFVSNGKVTRLVTYWDREHVLAELGLSEQDAHADS